jgi:uncharacterized membrane protein (UPF0127 family)
MLLVFDSHDNHSIWMLNMQFSLDILWIDSDGMVVYIEKNVPPCKTVVETVTCPSYRGGDKEAQYVLEVTAGFVDKNNITADSVFEIISI